MKLRVLVKVAEAQRDGGIVDAPLKVVMELLDRGLLSVQVTPAGRQALAAGGEDG